MKSQKGKKSFVFVAGFLLIAAIGVAAVVLRSANGREGGVQKYPTAEVTRGPLTISVTEGGTITARDQVVIKNEVEGSVTIISLVPEGQMVEKGELLIELDSSELQDEVVEEQIEVQNAEAAFIRARENLAVTENQARSDVEQAELDLQLAEMDLKKYLEGEYPNQLKEAESKITLANEERERATEKLAWSERLYDEKYISQTELESDRLAKNRAQLEYELAVSALDLLKEFTHKRKLAELESAVSQATMALERTTRKTKADVIQAEADLKAKEAELKQEKDRLAKDLQQIEKTKIYAPVSGMVVYATSAEGGWRGNDEPLQAGQTVRERQELIFLPTAEAMIAEIKVHESNLEKISIGMPVRITVDALPERVYSGRIKKIAPLPDATSVWLNPDLKVYNTQIEIVSSPAGLRTGMSCQAEILVERFDDALYVPLQAVTRVGKQSVVYIPKGEGIEPVDVEVGLDNNRHIRVIAGLQEGDDVILTPPISSGVRNDEDKEFGEGSEGESEGDGGSTVSAQPGESASGEESPDANSQSEQQSENAGEGGRPNFQNMSEEERQKMRERFQNMSEEDRAKLREQWQRRSGGESSGEGQQRPGGRQQQ